jgi:hypothetical protein
MPMQIGIHSFYGRNKGVDGEPPLAMTVAGQCRKFSDNAG